MLSFQQRILKAVYCLSLPGKNILRKMEQGLSINGVIDNEFVNLLQIDIDEFSQSLKYDKLKSIIHF